MKKILFIVFILFSGAFSCGGGAPAGTAAAEGEREIANLAPHMAFYSDESKSLAVTDVASPAFEKKFQPNRRHDTPYWIGDNAIWGKIEITPSLEGEDLYLFFHAPVLQNLELYYPMPGGKFHKIETGHDALSINKPFPGRKIYIPFPPELSGKTIYLRAYSPLAEFNLNTWLVTNRGLLRMIQNDIAFQFTYIGIILVMVIYNFFLYLNIRDRTYLLYSAYVITFGATLTGTTGLIQEYFIADFKLSAFVATSFSVIALGFGNLFVQNVLYLKKNLPKHYKSTQVIVYLLPLILATFAFSPALFNLIFYLVLSVNMVIVFAAGLSLYRKYSFARDFTRAWTILLASLFSYAMAMIGVNIPYISAYVLQTGGAIESLLLAFALARRIRYLQSEKLQYNLVKRDLAFAGKVQKHLFPQSPPTSKHYNIAWRYLPSTALSGDFYDYKIDKGALSLIIVDVAGHGYAAGLIASMVKVAFHETFDMDKSLKKQQEEINRILCEHLHFIYATALNLRILPEQKEFHLVRSGHVPLLHFKKEENRLHTYTPSGPALGVGKKYLCEQLTIPYREGDRLFAFTDGLIEELNHTGEEFGFDRLIEEFTLHADKSPEEFCNYLTAQIKAWNPNAHRDDISFLAIEFK